MHTLSLNESFFSNPNSSRYLRVFVLSLHVDIVLKNKRIQFALSQQKKYSNRICVGKGNNNTLMWYPSAEKKLNIL